MCLFDLRDLNLLKKSIVITFFCQLIQIHRSENEQHVFTIAADHKRNKIYYTRFRNLYKYPSKLFPHFFKIFLRFFFFLLDKRESWCFFLSSIFKTF